MQKKIVHIYKIVAAFTLMKIGGTIALLIRILSFGLLTDFNRKTIMPITCKAILSVLGISLKFDSPNLDLTKPHFITFNHNSYLDGFVLMAMGYTKTRFLLSEKMLHYIPLTLCALSIGVLYIPQQKHEERRLRFFKRLEKRLKKEHISFAGSAEGVHSHFHGIDTFNRGVFHTAMLCKVPVVSLFIYTPKESNPFNDFRLFKKGTIKVISLGITQTEDWKLENLPEHIENIKSKFVQKFNELDEK